MTMNLELSANSHVNTQAMLRVLQDELAATNREVMLLTLELEQRVAERTSQLSQANEQLAREVEERRRAEEEIKQLNQILAQRASLLEAANRELEAFSYSVSHDLRAPLRHVSGFAHILRQHTESRLDVEEQDLLAKIIEAASRMTGLIDNLLRFARLSTLEVAAIGVDLNELVESMIKEFEPEIRGRKIVWKCGILPNTMGDRGLLRQVFANLISNSIKYTRFRDPAEIEIGCQDAPDETVCFVRDNGVGFDSRYANKLFGVFQRLHSEEEFEGTGIGLANVRRIIERHGGRVWAEGIEGQGAAFYFSLPKQQAFSAAT